MVYIIGQEEFSEEIEKATGKSVEEFNFTCQKCGLCCSNSTFIPLSPMDIWWMKKRFNKTTDEIISEGMIKIVLEEETKLPRAFINLHKVKSEDQTFLVCPFVVAFNFNTGRNDKCPCGSGKKFKNCCVEKDKHIMCSMWDDRPATCRMYPMAYIVYWDNENSNYEGKFHLLKEHHCKGSMFNEYGEKHTIAEWVKQDDKLQGALDFNLKLAYYLKDVRAESYEKGRIEHKHINILANILYNFDSVLDQRLIILSDKEFSMFLFEELGKFLRNPDSFPDPDQKLIVTL